MKAVAWAPDGTIEAIEGENGFILGVQWHPECLIDEYSKRLFKALLNAANESKINR
ncbi:MAG: gamma-glutamyl-gamma-aminobutyrate hydrolase family protein [Syntrophomonas sp.]